MKKNETTTLRYVSPLPVGHRFADPAALLAYLDRCEAEAKRGQPEDEDDLQGGCATCPIR